MQTLFLAHDDLLFAIDRNAVPLPDLPSGLFMFGCTRAHALEPWSPHPNDVRLDRDANKQYDFARPAVAHATLLEHLLSAEADGRIVWRQRHEKTNFALLNLLLRLNGYAPVTLRGPVTEHEFVTEREIRVEIEISGLQIRVFPSQ